MKWKTDLPCTACGKYTEGGNALHHIMARKPYPEHLLKAWNLIPLCFNCHTVTHKRGEVYMSNKYPNVKAWLESNGWYICELRGSWQHEI